jgi:hypothetical protein
MDVVAAFGCRGCQIIVMARLVDMKCDLRMKLMRSCSPAHEPHPIFRLPAGCFGIPACGEGASGRLGGI